MSPARPRSLRFAGWVRASVLGAAALAAAGCASRGNTELLEANLRQHQDQLASAERQMSTLRQELVAARAESDQLRRELVALGKDGRQEATEPLARVAGIQFNSMMTGGRDADGVPGHDVITAVIAPHDSDGDLVKLAGELEIEVLDLTRSGDEQRIGRWKYTAEQARELWHSGFLASGYQLDLPIGAVPKTGQVILHGRLVTADGRQFDTTCPVTLAATDVAAATPGNFPAPPRSRPVSRSAPAKAPEASRTAVMTASAEVPEDRTARPVEQVGFAKLDGTSGDPQQSRPVPRPLEPAATAEELPVVRPGASPRPFPGGGPGADETKPRPFPSGTKTSDNWTDESIPTLR